ncbi:MAG: MarR family transcriptional regulator [Deltaproteobacteria bacterium]|nr:MarR family transcriptional regulator [Deltaproteobacteria bacterium]
MDVKEAVIVRLIEQFLRINNKFNLFEKTPMNFGIEELLYPSEIHTIDAIGRKRDINVTALAKILGITKGAVSQMISRLGKKGLVIRQKQGGNEKEVVVRLTPKGWKAYDGHERFHQDMLAGLMDYLRGIPMEDFYRFQEILSKIEYHYDSHLEKVSG